MLHPLPLAYLLYCSRSSLPRSHRSSYCTRNAECNRTTITLDYLPATMPCYNFMTSLPFPCVRHTPRRIWYPAHGSKTRDFLLIGLRACCEPGPWRAPQSKHMICAMYRNADAHCATTAVLTTTHAVGRNITQWRAGGVRRHRSGVALVCTPSPNHAKGRRHTGS
ncbi:hypothetical protein BD413DRAFT_522207, partial [Trametes elegans]